MTSTVPVINLKVLNAIELLKFASTVKSLGKNDKLACVKNNDVCIYCKGKNCITTNVAKGYIVCSECGTILKEIIDYSPDWTKYENKEEMQICGSNINNFFFPKSSIGTSIDGSPFSRLRIVHNWNAMPYNERSLYNILNMISTICSKHNIKKRIIDQSKILYKHISDCKYTEGKNKGRYIIVRGNNRKGLIASCVFYACKTQNEPRTQKEIANMFGLKVSNINVGIKKFYQVLDMIRDRISVRLEMNSAESYIERCGNKLHLHKDMIAFARTLSRNVSKLEITTKHTAPSVAAACLSIMVDEYKLVLTKKIIAECLGTSNVTLSKTLRDIIPCIKIIINDELTDKFIEYVKIKYKKQKC